MKRKFKQKKLKTELAKTISVSLQMLEEVVESNSLPYCIIGVNKDVDVENKKVKILFSTISDDDITMEIIINGCKSLLQNKGYTVTKNNAP